MAGVSDNGECRILDHRELAQISIRGAVDQLENTKSVRELKEIALWMFTKKDCVECSGHSCMNLGDFECLCCANGCSADKVAEDIFKKLSYETQLSVKVILTLSRQ